MFARYFASAADSSYVTGEVLTLLGCETTAGLGVWEQAARQALLAAAYYAGLVLLMRAAGKRLAGQTTTFDLIVLITLGVVLQRSALRPGPVNAVVFVVTVFALHRGLSLASSRSRRLLRGAPRRWSSTAESRRRRSPTRA